MSFSLLCLILTCLKPFNSGCWKFIHLQLNMHLPAKPGQCQVGRLLCCASTVREVRVKHPLCHVLSLASRLIPVGPQGQDCHCPKKPQGEEPCFPTCLCLRLKYTIESSPFSSKHMKPARTCATCPIANALLSLALS